MTLIKKILNKVLPNKQQKNEIIKMELFNKIVHDSYYDEKTNTLVVNVPTNIVLMNEGSQMFIAKNGYKIDIASQIHLNPTIPIKSKININKTKVNVSEKILELEESILT